MVVGVLRLSLVIPHARSLKDKRQAVKSVVDRIKSKFNVSAAEVGLNDVWQRAQLGFAAVANDHSFVNEVLDKVARDVELHETVQLASRELEIETFSEMKPYFGRPLDDFSDASEEWDLEAEEAALAEGADPAPKASQPEAGTRKPEAPAAGGGDYLREEDLE